MTSGGHAALRVKRESHGRSGSIIPFVYKSRDKVRVIPSGDSYLAVCDLPLNAVRVNAQAIRILELCDGTRSITGIAREAGTANEEDVLRVCEYFRERGFLEQEAAPDTGFRPSVTVIIPVRDRPVELSECLASVFAQEYPRELMEVIVIDDGSTDHTPEVARRFPCTLLFNETSRGQSSCRNIGAREASGEILAFLDSDCVAETTWLRELVVWFVWERIGAVGGCVDGYFIETTVDRYEQAASPLNMGKRQLIGNNDSSTLYVPTCNLLTRKQVFEETSGFRPDLLVGEDVDFCWRMRDRGHILLYVPGGRVKHKHRSGLWNMLGRRKDYGTSEALLYGLHPDRRKRFNVPVFAGLSNVFACIGVLSLSPWILLVSLIPLLFDIVKKWLKLTQARLNLPLSRIAVSVIRGHFSLAYFFSFHLTRYYLILMIPLGFLLPPLWLLSLCALLIATAVDYTTRRPKLSYPVYLSYYLLEHLAYQLGVAIGCLRKRKFGSYIPVLTMGRPRSPFLGGPSKDA